MPKLLDTQSSQLRTLQSISNDNNERPTCHSRCRMWKRSRSRSHSWCRQLANNNASGSRGSLIKNQTKTTASRTLSFNKKTKSAADQVRSTTRRFVRAHLHRSACEWVPKVPQQQPQQSSNYSSKHNGQPTTQQQALEMSMIMIGAFRSYLKHSN